MDQGLMANIRKSMEKKPTEKLMNIYNEHNESDWSPETFVVIYQILNERGVSVAPYESNYQFIGPTPASSGKSSVIAPHYLIIGAIVGAFLGYAFRPSAPLIGQLPLTTVISGGLGFSRSNNFLASIAQTSFYYLIGGAVIGGIIGVIIGGKINSGNSSNQKQGPEPVNPSQETKDVAEQLKKLANLKEQNLITDQEYQAKRLELLDRI